MQSKIEGEPIPERHGRIRLRDQLITTVTSPKVVATGRLLLSLGMAIANYGNLTNPNTAPLPAAVSSSSSNAGSEPTDQYSTFLERFCAQPGSSPIDIFIPNTAETVGATVYRKANDGECKKKGIPVNIVVGDTMHGTSGTQINGIRKIEYS